MTKSHWITLLKFVVAAAIFGVLFARYHEDVAEVLRRPKDWRWFSAALAIGILSVLLTFYRWYLLVWAQEIPFRFLDAVRLGFVGLVWNFVMPGMVGGDLVKALLIARRQPGRRTAAVATVALDRFAGLIGLFYVGSLAGLLAWHRYSGAMELRILIFVLWGVAAASTVATLILLSPAIYRWRWVDRLTHIRWIGPILSDLFRAMTMYHRKGRVVISVLAISVLNHLGTIGTFFLVGRALQGPDGYCPDLLTHYLITPMAFFAGAVVPLMGGLGITEGAVAWLYGLVAPVRFAPTAAQAQGVANSLAYRVIQLLIAAPGVVSYLRQRAALDEVVRHRSNAVQGIAADGSDGPSQIG